MQKKENSTKGRWLILKICARMITERPLWGYGPEGFTANYMNYQRQYLSRETATKDELLLADNDNHPLNELILFIINYGIFIGSILIIISLSFLYNCRNICFKIALTNAIILALFSYPFRYPLFLLILSYILSNQKHTKIVYYNKIIYLQKVLYIFFFFFLIYLNSKQLWLYHKWATLSKSNFNLYHYQPISFSNDPYLIYHDICNSYLNGQTKHCLSKLLFLEKYIKDYDTQMLKGDIYKSIGRYKEAISEYKIAHEMVPNRFAPLFSILQIYTILQDTNQIYNISRKIIIKQPKVPNHAILFYKEEATKAIKTIRNE